VEAFDLERFARRQKTLAIAGIISSRAMSWFHGQPPPVALEALAAFMEGDDQRSWLSCSMAQVAAISRGVVSTLVAAEHH
jgi:hypothetical protein